MSSPESLARREAQRRANRRVAWLGHAMVWAATTLFLYVVAGSTPAMIAGLAWAIAVAVHGFFWVAAPELRRHFIEAEVTEQLGTRVGDERRALNDAHARSLTQLSAGIAHEIRNPITAAKSLVQQIGEDPASPDSAEYARLAVAELDRVERSISHLLRYAREEDLVLRRTSVPEVIDSALDLLRDRLSTGEVRVDRQLDGAGFVLADADQLRRVVVNLFENALDAMDGSATPEPRLSVAAGQNLAGTETWLRVRDNGPGIPPDEQPKLFSPFYTSKAGGTGLGLALVKKVVVAHGGSIEVRSTGAGGTEVEVVLPSARAGEA